MRKPLAKSAAVGNGIGSCFEFKGMPLPLALSKASVLGKAHRATKSMKPNVVSVWTAKAKFTMDFSWRMQAN